MTDRDELVEQVALAMMSAYMAERGHQPDEAQWEWWETEARAAILATLKGVRIPTMEMRDAGCAVSFPAPSGLEVAIFTAMVDRRIKDFEG